MDHSVMFIGLKVHIDWMKEMDPMPRLEGMTDLPSDNWEIEFPNAGIF